MRKFSDLSILKENKGFTLVEIVIVITIIGILGATIVSIINPYEIQAQGRDNLRLAQINKIAQANELYFALNKTYSPVSSGGSGVNNVFNTPNCNILAAFDKSLATGQCYSDPRGCDYFYVLNTSTKTYSIATLLESKNFSVQQSPISSTGFRIVALNTAIPGAVPATNTYQLTTFRCNRIGNATDRVLIFEKKW